MESSSVTLDSPSAKFATPVKCHIDQLKPFVIPDTPSTSPTWDQGLRHQINIPTSPVSSRTRKRHFSQENSDPKSEPPHKMTTRGSAEAQRQKMPVATEQAIETSCDKASEQSATNSPDQESNNPPSRATSPFRREANALNRPKKGRLGAHLHNRRSKSAGRTASATQCSENPNQQLEQTSVPMGQDAQNTRHMLQAHQQTQEIRPTSTCLLYTSPSPRD